MTIRKLIVYGVIVLSPFAFAPLTYSQGNAISRREFSRLGVLQRATFFEKTIVTAAEKEKVDPLLLWTIAYNETRFRPWLTSPKNAKGLMQFIPTTAARFGLRDPYEPKAAIFAAARYVRVLSEMFGGRMDSVLAAYNAGEGTVSAYLNGHTLRVGTKVINSARRRTSGGVPPYAETLAYVRRGFGVYKALQRRKLFTTDVIAEVKGREAVKDLSNSVAPSNEVFYDTRTGRRILTSKKQDRSLDTGPVIVSPAIRSGVAASARTTFFRETKP